MFNRVSLKAKIISASCITLLLMAIVGIIGIRAIRSLSASSKMVEHTYVVIGEAKQILATAVDMETGMRGYLLAGKEDFLNPYRQGRKNFAREIAALSKTVDDNPAQVQLLGEAKATIDEWVNKITEPTIELRREIGDAKTMNDMADIVSEARGKVYFDKFRSQIATFIDREASLMAERQKEVKEATENNEVHIKMISDVTRWVEHTHNVIAGANRILAAAVDMETGMRGYLLAGTDEFLGPYRGGLERFNELVKSLSNTVNDNPAQVQLLNEIKDTLDAWRKNVTEPAIALRKKVGSGTTMNDVAVLVGEAKGKVYVDKLRGQLASFIDREAKLMAERQKKAEEGTVASAQARKMISDTARWVEHTHNVIAGANKILAAAVDMETGMRGYLLAGKDEFLSPYKKGRKSFNELIASLSKTVDNNPAQVQLLGEIKATIDEWQKKVTEEQIALRREIGDAKTMDDMADLVGEAKGKVYFDKFRDQIATFIDREAKLMAERQANAEKSATNSFSMIVGGIVIAVLIALIVSLILAGSVTRPFKQIFQGLKAFSGNELENVRGKFTEVIEGLRSGGAQVASASQEIAGGTSQQAASLEETSSSLEEMSSMTKANADNSNQANALMKEANKIVNQANNSMGEVMTSMDEISKASEETSKIIKTIDEIAFQTNLLALNAAVEAARAGEAGAGFAVVADEVKNLAMRSAEAAKNTSVLIEGTVKKVGEGSALVNKTNEAFREVAESAKKVGDLVSEISAASSEQSSGIGQVNTAVAEMDKVVQGNAASTEELSSQSEELNNMVGVLVEIVEGVKVGGKEKITESRAPAAKTKSNYKRQEISPQKAIPFDDEDFKDF